MLEKYSQTDIIYTIETLKEVNFITTSRYYKNPNTGTILTFDIENITVEGHNFLISVSNPSIWGAFTKKMSECGKMAFPVAVKFLFEHGLELFKS